MKRLLVTVEEPGAHPYRDRFGQPATFVEALASWMEAEDFGRGVSVEELDVNVEVKAHTHKRTWDGGSCPNFVDDSEHYGYEALIYAHGGGYEWKCMGIWRRRSDGQLFSWIGSGCSCNSPSDADLPDDLWTFDRDDFTRAALDDDWHFSTEEKFRLIRKAIEV
jgi:hypothetical protein